MSTDSRTVSTHTADYTLSAACSVITAAHPLTKTFTKICGVILTTSAAQMTAGTAHRVIVSSATELAQTLNSLTTNQAIMHGVFDTDQAKIYSRNRYEQLSDKTNATTRTNDATRWNQGGGVLVLDYDAPKTGQAWELDHLIGVISELLPLGQLAYVTAYSSSSYIFDGEQQHTGSKGLRIYILVQDATDIPRAGKVLFDRLWLAGHGHYELSAAGSLLERSAIDASVWQTSRLDFASGAACISPLSQRRPAAAAHDGAFLDTQTALPDLTPEQAKRLAELKAAAKHAIKPKAARIRDEYTTDRAKQQLDREGVQNANPAQIAAVKQQIERSLDGGKLDAAWLVMLADRSLVSIAEIYANRAKYHCATAKDPIEHDYNDYHTCAIIYTDRQSVRIVSQAHGQRTYECQRVDFARLNEQRIKQPHTDIAELFADHAIDCAVLAYSYAMARLPQIPSRYTLDALQRDLERLAGDRLAGGILTAIIERVAFMVGRRKKNCTDRLTVRLANDLSNLDQLDLSQITQGVYAIQAPTGTGKTQNVLQPLASRAKAHGQQVVAIAPLTSLVSELSERLGLDHYQDVKSSIRQARRECMGDAAQLFDSLATCINSLGHPFFAEFMDGVSVVLIDEFTQVLEAFKSKTTFVGGDQACFDMLRSIIRNADLVVVADANMNDDAVQFLRDCRQHDAPTLYRVKPTTGRNVVWYENDDTLLSQITADVINDDQNVWITCDTKAKAERIEKYLIESGIKADDIKLITADTKDKKTRDFLKNADDRSRRYRVVIASPSIKSGISIQHTGSKHFAYVAGFFDCQSVSSRDAYQMLGRVRYADWLHLSVSPQMTKHAIDADHDNAARDDLAKLEGVSQRCTTLDAMLARQRVAYADDQSNFSNNLYWTLEHYKCTQQRDEYSMTIPELDDIKEQCKLDARQRIMDALPIDDEAATELRSAMYLDQDQIDQLKAHTMRKQLLMPFDQTITDEMFDIDVSMIMRFGSLMQYESHLTKDDSGSDCLSKRRLQTARQRLFADLREHLSITPNALYDDTSASNALDYIESKRHALAAAGIIPKRFATRYYKRGKYAARELSAIFRHWGLGAKRIRQSKHTAGMPTLTSEVTDDWLYKLDHQNFEYMDYQYKQLFLCRSGTISIEEVLHLHKITSFRRCNPAPRQIGICPQTGEQKPRMASPPMWSAIPMPPPVRYGCSD